MKILLTNDDGLRAPGIEALFDALTGAVDDDLSPIGEEVYPIAPEEVQSATSHGVTFDVPIMTQEVQVNDRMRGVAVDGRPADCVKLALSALWPDRHGKGTRPDLVVSGMNAGCNAGINVIYSGTVAAAIEAAFLGVPSIAVSLHLGRGEPDFRRGARRARRAIDRVIRAGLLSAHSCVTINIPITEVGDPHADEMPEMVVCPMNTHGPNDRYERRVSPRGHVYYWAAGSGLDFAGTDARSDVQLLLQRKITLTPLWYDLTDGASLDRWRDRLETTPP